MSVLVVKLLLVCLLGGWVALRLLPVSGPGRYSLSLGLGGLFALLLIASMMWLMLVFLNLISPWVALLGLALLAVSVEILARAGIFAAQPVFPIGVLPAKRLPRVQMAFVAVLSVLIAVRVLTLLPDVLLRPLFAWDAWTVWGYEARVWLEMGGHVEFLPRTEWLSAPADAFIRDGLIAYPQTIPALILWAVAGAETWSGVGPGLLWLAAAGLTGLIIFGALRQSGLSMPWALGAAYVFLSAPLVNAHVALYGYADLWIAAVIAAFAALLLLAGRTGKRYWSVLSAVVLLPLPLIKEEGLYWLILGLAALLAGWARIGFRTLFVLLLGGLGAVWIAQVLGFDPVALVTRGRLGLSFEGVLDASSGAARHAFFWFDWHLFGYLAVLMFAVLLLRPDLATTFPALAAFCLLNQVLLWLVVPLTGAGAFLLAGTLFSRLMLQAAPALVLLLVLVGWRLMAVRIGQGSPQVAGKSEKVASASESRHGEGDAGSASGLGRAFGAMGLAAILVWGGLTVWALSGDNLEQRLLRSVELVPEIGAWQTLVGIGQLDEHGFRLLEPGRFGNVVVAIEISPLLDLGRFSYLEIHAVDTLPSTLSFGWSRSLDFQVTVRYPVDRLSELSGIIRVDQLEGWQDGAYFLSLEQIGFTTGPWVLESLVLRPRVPGFFELQRMFLASLFQAESWLQSSPHRIWSLDGALHFSPVPVVAIWILVSAGLMLIMGVVRVARASALILMPLVLGWAALDLRWQVELAQKARETYVSFAAIPAEDRFSVDLDGDLFDFLRSLERDHQRQLFHRVFALSNSEFLRKRARYHLASWAVREAPASALTPALSAHFQSGDLILLLDAPQLQLEVSDGLAHVANLDGQNLITGKLLSRQQEWIAIKVP